MISLYIPATGKMDLVNTLKSVYEAKVTLGSMIELLKEKRHEEHKGFKITIEEIEEIV